MIPRESTTALNAALSIVVGGLIADRFGRENRSVMIR
jgi:hypothetical protein